MVDKVAFKEILENAWIDSKETDMNKNGQTFVFQIAVYQFQTVQVKHFMVGGCWWWVVVCKPP